MSGDERPAVFVGTMLETGDAVALCDICLVGWCSALLNVMTGVDPEPFLRAVSEPDDVPTTAEGAPTSEPPAEQAADSDQDAASGAASPPGDQSPEPPPQGRKRAGNRSGRTSTVFPDRGTAGGPAANGTVTRADGQSPAV